MSAPVNRRRGEVAATLAGRPVRLCLTLGALAELEGALGAEDPVALARRFAGGRLATADLLAVLAAGLRGAGEAMTPDDLRELPAGSLPEIVSAVADLLAATFGTAPGDGAAAGGPAPNPP